MPRVANLRMLAIQECERALERLEYCEERKLVMRYLVLRFEGSLDALATDRLARPRAQQ